MSDVPSAELLARSLGDDRAAEELFRRYADRLTRLARSRLSVKLAGRVDAEDVVQSAYRSFFVLARRGDVSIQQSGDLWRLLARITVRKVCRNARRHRAECRSVEREQPWPEAEAEVSALAREPTPADAAALLDELREVLAPLGPAQRLIAEMRLQGHEIDEIAAAVGRSARTVRRTLAGLGEELQRRLLEPSPREATAPVAGWLDWGEVVLVRQLGEGGMGKVYRAIRWSSRADVAVKLLKKPLRAHPRAIERFLDEAELLSQLKHPGIVSVHGLGRMPDGGHFLVMDLVEGSDLARQRESGPIPLDQVLRWVAEAADAIEYAHQRGVVHCDLKPSNLLLGRDGRIRVSDFGLARSLADKGEAARGGTAGFMAPEQIDPERGEITARTDVYGLGAVLYALLDDGPPGEEYRPPRCEGELPPEVESLCRRCLEKSPEKRFGSAAELSAQLRRAGSG